MWRNAHGVNLGLSAFTQATRGWGELTPTAPFGGVDQLPIAVFGEGRLSQKRSIETDDHVADRASTVDEVVGVGCLFEWKPRRNGVQ